MSEFENQMNQLAEAIKSKNPNVSGKLTIDNMIDAVNGISAGVNVSDSTINNNNMLQGVIGYSADGTRCVGNIETIQPSLNSDYNTVIVPKGYNSSAQSFNVSGGIVEPTPREDITVKPEDVLKGKFYIDANFVKTQGAIETIGPETVTPSRYDWTASNVVLQGITVKGDKYLSSTNIKTGVSLWNIAGTFTEDANATGDDMFQGYTAYVKGDKIEGTIDESCSSFYSLTSLNKQFDLQGYYKTLQYQVIDPDIVPQNIRSNVQILKVKGTFTKDANATADTILSSYSAYVDGDKIEGTIPQYTNSLFQLSTLQPQAIPTGYYKSGQMKVVDQTIQAKNIRSKVNILGVDGTFTADATATADTILSSYSAYVDGSLVAGTIPQYVNQTFELTSVNQRLGLPEGYYIGCKIKIVDSDLVSENIKDGSSIFGIIGTYKGSCNCDSSCSCNVD